jgi:dsDNA-binding SOS-regulon protein
MERIITLLKEKNHYLEKFYVMNENELLNFADGNFENIESFYRARDKILDLIRTLDDIIEEESKKAPLNLAEAAKSEISQILREKDEWVTAILSQDLQVLSWVEKEKSSIIKELQLVRKNKKAIQGYHSGRRTPAVDEKA